MWHLHVDAYSTSWITATAPLAVQVHGPSRICRSCCSQWPRTAEQGCRNCLLYFHVQRWLRLMAIEPNSGIQGFGKRYWVRNELEEGSEPDEPPQQYHMFLYIFCSQKTEWVFTSLLPLYALIFSHDANHGNSKKVRATCCDEEVHPLRPLSIKNCNCSWF